MNELKEYLAVKRAVSNARAERLEERIKQLKNAYETNESYNSEKVDIHTRQQYSDVVCKQNELYAIVDFIDEIERRVFGRSEANE